jgi:hypothetical protein
VPRATAGSEQRDVRGEAGGQQAAGRPESQKAEVSGQRDQSDRREKTEKREAKCGKGEAI